VQGHHAALLVTCSLVACSDVTLIVSGGRSFSAHKVILAARSPVFGAMFAHEMKESLNGEVLLDDLSPAVMGELLK
jgi:speckle-type POZ protein